MNANAAEQPQKGPVDPKPIIPHTRWGKSWVQANRPHPDDRKLDYTPPINPQAEANLQGIIDQINRADMTELMRIQKNIADVLENKNDPKDRETVEKLKAINRRAEELLRVNN